MSAPEGYTEAGQPVICHTCGAYVAPSLVDQHERSHGNWLNPTQAVTDAAPPRDIGAEVDVLKREVRQHHDQLWPTRCRSEYERSAGYGELAGPRVRCHQQEGHSGEHNAQDDQGTWHRWGSP